MSIELTTVFRKTSPTDALRKRIERRVGRLEKYIAYPIKIDVRVTVDSNLYCVEITCCAEHQVFIGRTKDLDLYDGIDAAAYKIEHQLKKEREKKKRHKAVAHVSKIGSVVDLPAQVPHTLKKRSIG